MYVFFFFKQKTAYEMRISDWSSDVCSSDLLGKVGLAQIAQRRIAGAEIVERNANADRLQLVQRRQRIGVFREEHALGDLHLKPRRRKPVLAERREDHRRQVRIGELQRRQVDRQADIVDRKSTRLNSSH